MSCRRRAAGEYNADVEADLSNAVEGARKCYEVRDERAYNNVPETIFAINKNSPKHFRRDDTQPR